MNLKDKPTSVLEPISLEKLLEDTSLHGDLLLCRMTTDDRTRVRGPIASLRKDGDSIVFEFAWSAFSNPEKRNAEWRFCTMHAIKVPATAQFFYFTQESGTVSIFWEDGYWFYNLYKKDDKGLGKELVSRT